METTYIEQRQAALQDELVKIDDAIPKVQGQLAQLSSRRLLLQGALMELQDLEKHNGNHAAVAEKATEQADPQ